MACSSMEVNRKFGGICHSHHQVNEKAKQGNSVKAGGKERYSELYSRSQNFL
jgi:hypothetical protein